MQCVQTDQNFKRVTPNRAAILMKWSVHETSSVTALDFYDRKCLQDDLGTQQYRQGTGQHNNNSNYMYLSLITEKYLITKNMM